MSTQLNRRNFLRRSLGAASLPALGLSLGCEQSLLAPPLAPLRDDMLTFVSNMDHDVPTKGPMGHGVNLAGPEFGTHKPDFSNQNPGTFGIDFTYNSQSSLHYFSNKGLSLIRLPFSWERLQPTVGGKLDYGELSRIRTFADWASREGCAVVLDMHNYARYKMAYRGQIQECVIDQPVDGKVLVSRHHLASVWQGLAKIFKGHPAIVGYGIMNEPHDLGSSNWHEISQTVVDAIRRADQRTRVVISSDGWSSSYRWEAFNGQSAWIDDPADNVVYEAHCYFDSNFSGKYQLSYDSEANRTSRIEDRPERRLAPFRRWCERNNVQGFIGEYGVPQSDPRWIKLMDRFLQLAKQSGLDTCYWAGGEWWGDYPLSIQPSPNFMRDAPQMSVFMDALAPPQLTDLRS
ncbi:Endoglucanase [Planctomycetales bacterium 10988]|nr:Endoglucanase [Planctomycetales bacterium 10988]